MSSIWSTLLVLGISATSIYAARSSYISIVNLRQYEERSERAAKYSDTAAHQLYKTRVTQASSAAAITLSLSSSVALVFRTLIGSSSLPQWECVLSILNVVAVAAAFAHNRSFWKAKAKVPFVGGFNEGIEKSKEMRQLMIPLGVAWGLAGVLRWIQE